MNFPSTLYFDYQATTPVDDRVFQQMRAFFENLAANPHSLDHSLGWKMSELVESARSSVARLVGADADEIVFTSGATESNNLALSGICRHAENPKGRRRIIVSAIEHKCVLAVANEMQNFGYTFELIPVDAQGRVSVETLAKKLDDDVMLVSIIAVNNEIGTIQDIPMLAAEARRIGAVFHCDAAQAPVAMELGQFADHVDLLSLSAHKMYGPQGIGALYIRRELQTQIKPIIYGGGQQDGLRSGTLPVALCVGMGEAAEIINSAATQEARNRLFEHRELFVDRLRQLPWETSVNGPLGKQRHPGNANIRFHGFSASDVLQKLQPHLAASTGSACTTGIPEPSHVLRAIGLNGTEAEESIRFSLGFGTTKDEIDKAVILINDALQQLAQIPRSA